MPTPNFFNTDAFNAISLTQGINRFPNRYGRLAELGLFNERGVTTTNIAIEERNGVLNLLQTQPRGAPATMGTSAKRKVRSFTALHIPHEDVVLPEEVQDVRAFGSENTLQTQAEILAQKLADMSNKHDITLEHLRVSALRGLMIDADGSTLLDMYSAFGLSQTTVNFALTTATTKVITKIHSAKRTIETKLQGEVMSTFRCLCSPTFFDALVTHVSVEDAYRNWQAAQDRLGGDNRTGFTHGGVIFEEYNGSATDIAGNVRRFIPDDEAYLFPLGTQSTFVTYFAPADFNEAANSIGLRRYAKLAPRRHDRGWDLHTQSNPLPLVMRPEVVIKLTKA